MSYKNNLTVYGLENVAERKKRIAYFYPQRSTNFVSFDEDSDAIGTQINQIYTTYIIQITLNLFK